MDEIEIVCSAIDRLATKLQRQSDLEYLNALLSLAPEERVFPSPAVGLLEVSAASHIRLSDSTYFRSVDAIGTSGEVILTPVNRRTEFHAWRIESVDFKCKGGATAGVSLTLVRDAPTSTDVSWLPIMVDAPRLFEWAFRDSIVSHETYRIESRCGSEEIDKFARSATRTGSFLHMLACQMLYVKFDGELSKRESCTLDFDFLEPVDGDNWQSRTSFRVNVIPVWNSLPARYPVFERAEANLSGRLNRLVHPLTTEALGRGWTAWAVTRVGAGADNRLEFVGRGPAADFRLGVVPHSSSTDRTFAPTRLPGVVLSRKAADSLESAGQRLMIDFLATTGSTANAVPKDAVFRLMDSSGFPQGDRLEGKLVCATIGGADGLLGTGDLDTVRAIVPSPRARTIRETVAFLEHDFGQMLEVADPLDLVRPSRDGEVPELVIRVKLKPRYAGRLERRVVLAACQDAVERYLAVNDIGPIIVREYSS